MLEGIPMDPSKLGEWIGTFAFTILLTVGGLFARNLHLEHKRRRPRLQPRNDETPPGGYTFDPNQTIPMGAVGRVVSEARVHSYISEARKEILSVVDELRAAVDKVESELRTHIDETSGRARDAMERLRTVEVKVDGMELTMQQVREDRIRERQEILESISNVRKSLDNLQNITIRALGQREGDPFNKPRPGGTY